MSPSPEREPPEPGEPRTPRSALHDRTEPAARLTGSGLGATRLRLLLVLVPIHLAAFTALYLGALHLLEDAYADAGAQAARQRLDQAVREMPFFVPRPASGRSPHVFDHLLVAHAPIQLRLFDPAGRALGSRLISADPEDIVAVRAFLAGGSQRSRVWIERDGEREIVYGLHRLQADLGCTPCHEEGELLGAATMRIDYTAELTKVRAGLRLRVGFLICAWMVLVGVVSVAVRRSVRRSATRLEAELQAAASGRAGGDDGAASLPLDPVAAEVHRGLWRMLERQRQREAEVTTRLAHVEQLASLGQLAAGLAHEIKNPLAGIQGALEVLRDEAGEESETSRLYGEMLGELQRVDGILHTLLESGRPAPLRLAKTDIAGLLTDTADLLAPGLRRRGVELKVEAAGDLPQLRLDPAKIRQVLVNLVQNAGDAMPCGGHVTMRASPLPQGVGLVLEVADDGPGIRGEDTERIFQPFYTTKFAGTGLGLAISKSLVEQHGGTIEVDSEPGSGTRFFLFLPEAASPAFPTASAS